MTGDARPTLFLADLHLPAEPSPLREGFLAFLHGPAREAAAVYILGDLFEYWIGDDVGMQVYAREIAALTALTKEKTPVYFQHGNRDFLVGKAFAQTTGVQLLADPVVIELHGIRTLISHGDIFCTDDIGYQRWRRFSRNPVAQWVFGLLPRARREKIAGGVRSGSDAAKRNKADAIMDVNPNAVREAMDRHAVTRLIHGHTHRPAEHQFDLMHGPGERIVLADWVPKRTEILHVTAQGVRREAGPF